MAKLSFVEDCFTARIVKNLYDYILHGLRDLSNTETNENAFKEYLKSLQPSVKALRAAYKTDRVQVDYSSAETQAAYLVAYYPQYAEMTYDCLKRLTEKNPLANRKELQVCLLASGPLPEVAGLVNLLKDHFPQIDSVVIHAFDIAAESWKISHNIVKRYIISSLWNKRFELRSNSLNLCSKGAFELIEKDIKNSQLFIFQNFLNELTEREEIEIKNNIEFLLNKMPTASSLILADVTGHNVANKAKNKIQRFVEDINCQQNKQLGKAMFTIFGPEQDVRLKSELEQRIPKVIQENLLLSWEDGLKPKRWVTYNFIEVSKVDSGKFVSRPTKRTLREQQPTRGNQVVSSNTEKDVAQPRLKTSSFEKQLQALQMEIKELKQAGQKQEERIAEIETRLLNSRMERERIIRQVKMLQVACMVIGFISVLSLILLVAFP